MNRVSNVLLLGSGVLVFAMAAHAQNWGQRPYYPQREDPYYRTDPNYGNNPNRGYDDDRYSRQGGYPDQGRYGNDRYGYGRNQGSLIEQVLSDLNRAAANARLDGHESKHFDNAARQLEQFDDRWARGKFDSGKLRAAIEDLEHLANADRVSGRDREILARDIYDLRQFQSTRGQSSNYGNQGYRDNRNAPYNDNLRYGPNWR